MRNKWACVEPMRAFRAAEVSVSGGEARFVAAAGEANQLGVTWDETNFTFLDSAPLVAGAGCAPAPGGAVACRAQIARVDLGDGDDRAQVAPTIAGLVPQSRNGLVLDGGPGSDVLSGGGTLVGGAGNDALGPGVRQLKTRLFRGPTAYRTSSPPRPTPPPRRRRR